MFSVASNGPEAQQFYSNKEKQYMRHGMEIDL